jgi:hypothetical protein
MTMETAKSALDWLWSIGCRVVPLMGGEPLIRKDFVLGDPIRCSKGFHVSTHQRVSLINPLLTKWEGWSGYINLAVDCIAPRKGLPKALLNIELSQVS